MKDNSAVILRDIWNKILLSKSIDVCTDKLQGIGFLEIKVLKLIYFNPSYKIKDLLVKLDIPNSTLTNVVNRLVKKNLISRNIDRTDLRSFGLELTPDGKEAIAEHLDAETNIFEAMLNYLNDEERKEFIRIISKIVADK